MAKIRIFIWPSQRLLTSARQGDVGLSRVRPAPAMIRWAMIGIMVRRLSRPGGSRAARIPSPLPDRYRAGPARVLMGSGGHLSGVRVRPTSSSGGSSPSRTAMT
ncbi:hypothetical protein CEB94_00860 [Streptomyces hawaiiensis]|uniref:Uncharacterized protein n=1 Tax=Streptomyces hawaiiensis TaxID=67305 RepID=A0A6G5R7L8_9ACTN|nr:hypothetical protein CEB94_00860 [Streptomyces hawaiiensis]